MRVTERDVEMILDVLDCAAERRMAVSEVVQHLLAENRLEIAGLRKELRHNARRRSKHAQVVQGICQCLEADNKRIRRLMRMFASWRMNDEPDACGVEG
jgi:hypothetical protein